jgi:hypothetical protein
VPEGTVRFVRAVSKRSHAISVRGKYTHNILRKYGIQNVTVTGCPSLHMWFQPDKDTTLLSAAKKNSGPTLLHSTRYSAEHRAFTTTRSIHLDLYRYAFATQNDLLLQSESEEISLLVQAASKPDIPA